ncbi:Hydrophobin [Abortiporus biennis]
MYVNMKSFFVVSVLFSSVLITQVQGIPNDSPPPSYCNTGTQQCCDQSNNAAVTEIASLLGIVLGDLKGLVGLGCTPIIGNSGCSAEVACCQDNSYGDIISLGCSHIL